MVDEDGMAEKASGERYDGGKESYEGRRENVMPEAYREEQGHERTPSPPPVLPEIGKVNGDGFLGGGDMFRDIN